MIGLGAISALLALIGLLVPIVIHLLSNRESKELLFGSTRFLQEQESVNPKSVVLTDFGQLVLRCGLIATAVLLAALPYFNNNQSNKQIWIEQEILDNPQYESYVSQYSNSEPIPFAIGSADSTISRYPSLWTVIAAANAQKDSVDIFTFNRMRDYLGSTLPISDRVKINAVPYLDDRSDGSYNDLVDAQIVIRMYIDQSSDNTDQLAELINVIADELGLEIVVDQEDYDWFITSAAKPIPSDKYGLIWDQSNGPLTILNSTSNTLVLTGEISRTEILESDIPVIIGSRLIEPFMNLDQSDSRQMTERYRTLSAEVDNSSNLPISAWWWLLILPLFLWERYVAHKKLSV